MMPYIPISSMDFSMAEENIEAMKDQFVKMLQSIRICSEDIKGILANVRDKYPDRQYARMAYLYVSMQLRLCQGCAYGADIKIEGDAVNISHCQRSTGFLPFDVAIHSWNEAMDKLEKKKLKDRIKKMKKSGFLSAGKKSREETLF